MEMTGETVTVTYSRTINLGDYNSVKLELTINGVIGKNETRAEGIECLWTEARESVAKQYADLMEKKNGNASDKEKKQKSVKLHKCDDCGKESKEIHETKNFDLICPDCLATRNETHGNSNYSND